LNCAAYFAKRTINGANKIWEEQNWDNEKVVENSMLKTIPRILNQLQDGMRILEAQQYPVGIFLMVR